MPAKSTHRPGYDPKARRPKAQPVTPQEEVTKGGFSEAVATYHDRQLNVCADGVTRLHSSRFEVSQRC